MSQDATQDQTLQVIQQVFLLATQGRLSYTDLSAVGKVLVEANNLEVATYLYQTWIANTKSPMTYIVYTDLGDILANAGKIAEARTAFQNSLQLNGAFERARNGLAKLPAA